MGFMVRAVVLYRSIDVDSIECTDTSPGACSGTSGCSCGSVMLSGQLYSPELDGGVIISATCQPQVFRPEFRSEL